VNYQRPSHVLREEADPYRQSGSIPYRPTPTCRLRTLGHEDHELIFATRTGTPVSPEHLVKRSFKPLLKNAGLPEIRFHDLRHTCATLLLSRGVHPKLVQELLGHATIAMTLDTYSHYLPSMGNQASGAMGDALG
jgi:integrase